MSQSVSDSVSEAVFVRVRVLGSQFILVQTQAEDLRLPLCLSEFALDTDFCPRPCPVLTLIRESWKKIQNAGPSPSAFRGKNPERSVASFIYVSVLWIFFPELALGHGPKKWHTFLFSTAYFLK